MSNTFIDANVTNADPVIEPNPLITYVPPTLQPIEYEGWTGNVIELEIGETTSQVIERATTGVFFFRHNLLGADKTGYAAAANKVDYINNTLVFASNPVSGQIQNKFGYSTNISNKNSYLNNLKTAFITVMAQIRTEISARDALINDTQIENVNQVLSEVASLLKENEYLVYGFVCDVLSLYMIEYTNMTSAQMQGYAKYLLDSKSTPVDFNSDPSVQDISDLRSVIYNASSPDSLDTMWGRIKAFINDENLGDDLPYTYEQMKELSEDMTKIFDIVSFVASANTNITDLFNKLLELKTILVNKMNFISFHSEQALGVVSQTTNNTPYEVGNFLLEKYYDYQSRIKTRIRLTPTEGSRRRY